MSDSIFIVLLAVIGGLIGSSLHLLVRGRSGLLVATAAIALGGSVVSKLAGASLGSCMLGVGLAVALTFAMVYQHKHRLELSILRAPQLVTFATRNFHVLDADGDGNITLADLWDCWDKGRILPQDRDFIRALEQDMDYIGHVAGVTIASCPNGGAVSVPHFAISRQDLETYTTRIRAKYESDIGEKLPE
jgi:hypothetical protein